MTDINRVTVSRNDDSFFVLHAKEYDNIFECRMLPEVLNRIAVVYQLERNSELQLNVSDKVDFCIKGGDVRHIFFLEKGGSKLQTSPSKKTFTIAADVDYSCEDVKVPELQSEKRASISMFVDKVARRLSTTYGVSVPDPSTFSAVAKAIFGQSGGSVQCKKVLVDLPEGSLTSDTKEVCIQLCKARKEVVPLSDTEEIVSHLVEISPLGKPLCAFAELCLPIEGNVKAGHAQFLRWTPTQSGERANWSDVLVCDKKHRSDESQITLKFKESEAKVFTKHFGIFGIIDTSEPKAHQKSINNNVSFESANNQTQDDRPTLFQRIGNMFKRGDTQKQTSDCENSHATSPSTDPTMIPPPVSSTPALAPAPSASAPPPVPSTTAPVPLPSTLAPPSPSTASSYPPPPPPSVSTSSPSAVSLPHPPSPLSPPFSGAVPSQTSDLLPPTPSGHWVRVIYSQIT
ncbi:uncharacterized protein LOC111325105 [Stylophora pistillata]|nr:uncharacterized protein LOC111325105 [Stylophora pistillata]